MLKVSFKSNTTLDGKPHEENEILNADGLVTIAFFEDHSETTAVGHFGLINLADAVITIFSKRRNGLKALELVLELHKAKPKLKKDDPTMAILKSLLG